MLTVDDYGAIRRARRDGKSILQNGVADLVASLDFRNRGFNLVVLGL
jgi:hypothetical protein